MLILLFNIFTNIHIFFSVPSKDAKKPKPLEKSSLSKPLRRSTIRIDLSRKIKVNYQLLILRVQKEIVPNCLLEL